MSEPLIHPLLLAEVSNTIFTVCILAALAIGAGGAVVAIRLLGGRALSEARQEAEQLVADAKRDAENQKRQMELDFREELSGKREEFEKEVAQKRKELQDNERELSKREDDVDRKLDVLGKKEKTIEQADNDLKRREQKVQQQEQELEETLTEQREKLQSIAKLSHDEAKKLLMQRLEEECKHEAGQMIQREVSKAEEEAKERSMNITLQAIQRYAAEHTSASTVAAVDIPSDDMKGRVIGREGRNIRAFEKATGVDVIVDDTPGVVVVSCFDPIRRAIAAEALQQLIEDGRIHPTRIEDVVQKIQKEMDERIMKYGKEACIEANIQGLHQRLTEMMGRLHFRTSYGQNILRHSLETAYLCQVIAEELGLDGTIARRCGFLHDIGKAMDHEAEGGHPYIGMEFARKFDEREEVLNAIGGHHGDIESTSPYTPIVMAADAISGARPGARRETLDRYIKRLQQLEGIATDFGGVREAYAIQAGREVRVIVDADQVDDSISAKLARDIANRVEQEMTYPGEVRVTVLREVRSVEYAR